MADMPNNQGATGCLEVDCDNTPDTCGAGCGRHNKPTPPASQESAGEAQLAHLAERCATLTAELAEARKQLGVTDARLHEVAALCAATEQQRDRLAQENLERAEAVIAQAANARNLADALKKLNNAARISGGVAGADKNLMDACENAERALSFAGTGRAVNAVLDVLEQRDSLRDECERLREALDELVASHAPGANFPEINKARAALSASGRRGEE